MGKFLRNHCGNANAAKTQFDCLNGKSNRAARASRALERFFFARARQNSNVKLPHLRF